MAPIQTKLHSHSGRHEHTHHNEKAYLISKNKSDAAVRITRLGLLFNLAMAAAKAVGGYIFNSQSMMADAWHSFTDLASDFLTLATVSWSTKPPTTDFPMGLGKVESLGSLGVSGMLFIGGIFMGIGTCKIIYAQFFLDTYQAAECVTHGHPHGCSYGSPHGNDQDVPGIHAAWLAISTVLGKEWLYHASMYPDVPA